MRSCSYARHCRCVLRCVLVLCIMCKWKQLNTSVFSNLLKWYQSNFLWACRATVLFFLLKRLPKNSMQPFRAVLGGFLLLKVQKLKRRYLNLLSKTHRGKPPFLFFCEHPAVSQPAIACYMHNAFVLVSPSASITCVHHRHGITPK